MIEDIRRRFEAATPGPYEHDNGALEQHWSVGDSYTEIVTTNVDCMNYCYGGTCAGILKEEDAEFLAGSWSDVKNMLELINRVKQMHNPMSNSASVMHPAPLCTCGQQYPCDTMKLLNEQDFT